MTRDANDLRGATIDHVHPRSLGGKLTLGNRVAACRTYNQAKADLPADAFREVMAEFQRTQA